MSKEEAARIKLQKPQGKVYAFFIDFKRAFPSISHNLLWKKLSVLGVSYKLINVLISLYQNAIMLIKNQHGTSKPIEITEGLLQGEILSPLLFSLFISDLENFLRLKGIRGISISKLTEILLHAYADDIVVVSNSPALMKRILKAHREYWSINQLVVNIKKTNIVIFSKGGKQRKETFYFGEEKVEIIKKYTYLGIAFVGSALFEVATKEMFSKASLASSSTINHIKNTLLATSLKN